MFRSSEITFAEFGILHQVVKYLRKASAAMKQSPGTVMVSSLPSVQTANLLQYMAAVQ